MSALIAAKQRGNPAGWRAFQERAHALKNRRTRARREAEDLAASLFAAQTALRLQSEGALGMMSTISVCTVLPTRTSSALTCCLPMRLLSFGPVLHHHGHLKVQNGLPWHRLAECRMKCQHLTRTASSLLGFQWLDAMCRGQR